jgi:hypothetical protein
VHPNYIAARLSGVTRLLAVTACVVCLGQAQAPKIGEINYYGLHKVTPDKVLSALSIRPGAVLPPSKGDMEERLTEISGVIDARVEAVCCQGAAAALFIGIQERGAPHFDTRSAPAGSAILPDDLQEHYQEYLSASARKETSAVRRYEAEFTAFATGQLDLLRDVLRNGSEPDQRAIAAVVIAYAKKPADVVNDLQYALQDPEDAVRVNAARSLKGMAVAARKDPSLGIRVAPVWLAEMLNSIVLSDRLIAAETLVVLTDQPNPTVLDVVRDRASAALADMARWSTLDYALPAYLLLGRTAGIPEPELLDQWEKGGREAIIRRATAKR